MTRTILLRLPDELGDLMDAQVRAEGTSASELLREGLVIRCKLPIRDKLPDLLAKWGYTPVRAPGRPKTGSLNGSEPADPADEPADADVTPHVDPPLAAVTAVQSGPAEDGWELNEP
jgi:hypothetical protein